MKCHLISGQNPQLHAQEATLSRLSRARVIAKGPDDESPGILMDFNVDFYLSIFVF